MSNDITKAAKALLDAITFDDCGALVGGKFIGGNGGLISRETIKRADELRRALIQFQVPTSAAPGGKSK